MTSLILEVGIFASQGIWLYRTRRVRKAAKEAGMTYDEFVEATGSKEKTTSDETPPPSRALHVPAMSHVPQEDMASSTPVDATKNATDASKALAMVDVEKAIPPAHQLPREG